MQKLLVTDFNYLLDKEDAIPVSTMLEIERIRKKDISFVVITDKLVEDVLIYNKDFPFLDYIMSLNCSYIYDVNNDKCIYKKKLNNSAITKLTKLFTNNEILYFTEDKCYKSIDDIKNKEVLKIEVILPKEETISEQLEKINVNTTKYINGNTIHLNFTAPKASKFLGIDNISIKNNLNLKDVFLITDNIEDKKLFNNTNIITNSIDDILKKI